MNYYKSLKMIPIFNFFEVIESEDIRYSIILDNYNDLPEITEKQQEELTENFKNLTSDYSDYNENNKIIENQFSIVNLYNRKNKVNAILFLLYNYKYDDKYNLDSEYLESTLKGMGYKLEYSTVDEFYKAIDKINTKGIDYKIKVKEVEIKNLTSGEKQSYREAVVLFEELLSINIDIYKKTIVDFIAYRQRCMQKIKQTKKVA